MRIEICTLQSEEEIRQIVELQRQNLQVSLSIEKASLDGFVTVQHTYSLLEKMNEAAPQIIAKDGEKVAGYALVMPASFKKMIPVLEPMFDKLEKLDYENKKISEYRYYVMGQICVADGYRGMGIFDQLYQKHKELLSPNFDLCITEIASRNARSMRAHERVGFKTLHTYQDKTDHWNIVAWDWK